MNNTGIKTCQNCRKEKPIEEFPLCRKWRGNICKICRDKIAWEKLKANPDLYKKKLEANKKHYTKNPIPKQLLGYKNFDKGHGYENDLDIDYLRELLSKVCTYCGSTEKIGLDRTDSKLGHTKNNVVPCCARCNYLKRDMPLEAWLYLVPAIKLADQNNAFGGWSFNLKKVA